MSTGIDTVLSRPAIGTLSPSRSAVERLLLPGGGIAAVEIAFRSLTSGKAPAPGIPVTPGRASDDEISIFDSTGTALQDVVAAIAVYHRALQGNEGARFMFNA